MLLQFHDPSLFYLYPAAAFSSRRDRNPTPAKQYSPIATSSKARMPNTSERFSSNPPATAPNMFAPRAALGDSAIRNSKAKSIPAKNTGTANTAVATAPAKVGDPEISFNGSHHAITNPASNAAKIQ